MTLILYLLFVPILLMRLFRWSSLWQQKEYRLDRLWAFLKTSEGIRETVTLITFPLKKSDLKRPHLTKKMLLVLVSFGLVSLSFFSLGFVGLAILYLLTPLWLIVATIPANIFTYISLLNYENMAIRLFDQNKPYVIGVSGSYGKTTTKILIGELLKVKYKTWVSPKSHNNRLSIAQAITRYYSKQEIVVLEYAAYKIGEIADLVKRYPADTAVFTGINTQHLAIFGGEKKMIKAESELVESLEKGAQLFYNSYDSQVSRIAHKYKSLKLTPAKNCKLSKIQLDHKGYLSFKLSDKLGTIKTQLVGRHYLPNIKQAINVARAYHVSDRQISQALKLFHPGDEFIQRIETKSGYNLIIDDRTSNPDGFLAAIDLLDELKSEHKIIISAGIIDLASAEKKTHKLIAHKIKQMGGVMLHTSNTAKKVLSHNLENNYYSVRSPQMISKVIRKSPPDKTTILIEGKIRSDMHNLLLNL